MQTRYFVLDVEASGLQAASFPISVAWGCAPDAIEYHIIRPEPDWLEADDGWDFMAEDIHGFTLEQLQDEGEPAFVVARRLASALNGHRVLCDAPEHDRAWLDKLHADTGVGRTYDIEHICRRLPKIYHPTLNHVAYEALREQAFARAGVRPHTADGDVKALLTMLQIAGS